MKLAEAIEKGHEVYFKNAYWKDVYENAPEDAKRYYDLIFSQYVGRGDSEYNKEFMEEKDGMYGAMTENGWAYVMKHTTSNIAKSHLKKQREKFSKADERK